MKRVIRKCVFESNSSTSHSCIIMTEEQHKKWEEGHLYYYSYYFYDPFEKLPEDERPKQGCLYTQDEVFEFYKLIGYEYRPEEFEGEDEDKDPKDIFIKEMGYFVSYNDWQNDEYMEFDENYFTTPGGEKIIVECKFGRDG